jgi:hypothetical protein
MNKYKVNSFLIMEKDEIEKSILRLTEIIESFSIIKTMDYLPKNGIIQSLTHEKERLEDLMKGDM